MPPHWLLSLCLLDWAVWILEDLSVQPSTSCSHSSETGVLPIPIDPHCVRRPFCGMIAWNGERGTLVTSQASSRKIRSTFWYKTTNRDMQVIICFSSCLKGCRIFRWAQEFLTCSGKFQFIVLASSYQYWSPLGLGGQAARLASCVAESVLCVLIEQVLVHSSFFPSVSSYLSRSGGLSTFASIIIG